MQTPSTLVQCIFVFPATSVDAVSPSQRQSSSEFVEVSEQEFESVSPTVRGSVTLADINNVSHVTSRTTLIG